MKRAILIGCALASLEMAGATLSNGSLTVEFGDTGTIRSVIFDGDESYPLVAGTPGGFGFQQETGDPGDRTATFAKNTFGQEPVVTDLTGSTANSVNAEGAYTTAGANVEFTRVYSLLNGNVLRVSTTITNLAPADINLRMFDSYNPIPAGPLPGLTNANDISGLAGGRVVQVTDASSVVVGSLDPGVVISAAGFGASINTGIELSDHFAIPEDPDGALANDGYMIGVQRLLTPGSSYTFVYDHAFGNSAAAAQAAFAVANGPAAIPEPSTWLTLATGIVALLAGTRLGKCLPSRE
jgi:hypothetical protein